MKTIAIEQLRGRAQAFMEDVSREGYLTHAGRKHEAELQAIYAQYADILDGETLQFCIEQFQNAEEGGEEQRAARMMLDWQIEGQLGQRLAELEEREIELENTAVVRLDDREISYQEAPITIVNTTDRRERNAIDAARARVAQQQFEPLALEQLQREKEYVEGFEIAGSYNQTFELLSGVSLQILAEQCSAFLRDTQAMWDDVLRERLSSFGILPEEATRADGVALLRLKEYDAAFPASAMESSIRRHCDEIGIDASANGRIIFDLDDRAGKRSRAFCAPVQIPDEVYLVMRPHGGQTDYNTLLHELGHALHFGYMREDYPFEYRWLGDNSVTEAYAMLFDHRMLSRGWLLRYTELGRNHVDKFLRMAAFEEFQFLRRYAAKSLYEIQVYDGTVPWQALPDVYVETLGQAMGLRYRREDAFIDLDPHYYSTRYLRAWQLQAVIDESLTHRFDEDWWRNPAAGPWMVQQLFCEGQRESAHEIAARVGSSGTLSFTPLIKRVETLLAT